MPDPSQEDKTSGNQKASESSPRVESENGAMATLNVGDFTLSTCFISKSPSCRTEKEKADEVQTFVPQTDKCIPLYTNVRKPQHRFGDNSDPNHLTC